MSDNIWQEIVRIQEGSRGGAMYLENIIKLLEIEKVDFVKKLTDIIPHIMALTLSSLIRCASDWLLLSEIPG